MSDARTIEAHEVVLEVRGVPGDPGSVALVLRDEAGHRAERDFAVDIARPLPEADATWAAFLVRYAQHHSTPAERRAFGDDLFRALMDVDEFAVTWMSIVGASARRPLRIVVLLHPGSEPFAKLPLELLRDARGDVLAVPGSALIRTLPDTLARGLVLDAKPRVLLAWATPTDQHVFDPTSHEEALRAIHGERLSVLPHARLTTLRDALAQARHDGRPFQLVQIIAHGFGAFGNASLAFENEHARTETVAAVMLARCIREQGVELVALCSCQSGIGFAGVGQTLLARNGADVACVVACQADLPVAGSATLLARFHALLLETRDPALALGRARREAFDAGDAWSVPVLLARPELRPVRKAELFGIPPRVPVWQERDALVAQVTGALRHSRIVTTVGIPGVGKTEICYEVARQMLAQRAIARAICIHVQSGMQVDQLRAMLAAALGQPAMSSPAQIAALLDGDREILIVLDNLEDLLGSTDSARALVELMDAVVDRTSNARFLSSSRWRILAPREAVVEVGPLPKELGAALLALELAAAGHEPSDWLRDEGSWRELADLLRGQARAIRLLGARWGELRLNASAALAELRDAVAAAKVDWTLLGSQTAFAKLDASALSDLRVLAAAFGLALQRLGERSPQALDALRRLLLFPAGLPERTAMLVAGGPQHLGLQQLYERRLVDWRDGRVHVPVLLQGGAFVAPAVGVQLRDAFAAAMLGLGMHAQACNDQFAAGDIRSAVVRLMVEHSNLVVLEQYAGPNREADATRPFSRLAWVALGVMDFAEERRHALPIAETGIRIAQHHCDRVDEALLHKALGKIRIRESQLDAARTAYLHAIDILRRSETPMALADCLNELGGLHMIADDAPGARPHIEEAIELLEGLDAGALGDSHRLMGDVCLRTDDFAGAVQSYGKALEVCSDTKNRLGEANCLKALGDVFALTTSLDTARSYYRRARAAFREIEEPHGDASCLFALGGLRAQEGLVEDAQADYLEALDSYRRIGARREEAECLRALGDLWRSAGLFDAARDALAEALLVFRETKSKLGEANCHSSLAVLALRRSAPQLALPHLRLALDLHAKLADLPGLQGDWGYMAQAALSLGATDHALAFAERSLAIGRRMGLLQGQAITLELQANAFGMLGESNSTIAAFACLLEVAHQMDHVAAVEGLTGQLEVLRVLKSPAEWSALRANAEAIRAAAVAAAERRIRDSGGSPEVLP